MNSEKRDLFLEERLKKIDNWMMEGKIPTPSKIIPVAESLLGLQWILPTQQALEVLRNMRTFAPGNCFCRERYNHCDNPLEVCIRTNDAADQWVGAGKARYIDLAEAKEMLKMANDHGLIHLTILNKLYFIFFAFFYFISLVFY